MSNGQAAEVSSLSAALSEWRCAVGDASVLCDAETARRTNTATFTTSARAAAVLRPADREQVQQCVRIANRCQVPLYPISTGKNWGYGSRVPVRDAVLLDLSHLNRIVDFNEDLAYVTVEPGVTQRQLYDFLQSKGGRLWMDATGSSPDCSLIGNTLERGFGHTPMGDHCSHACGFEVVLPNGEVIQTGFSRFTESELGPLGKWGVGPSLDGLFSQSNLGIVTKMSIWLMPAPEHFEAMIFQSNEPIEVLIDALRPLKLNGTLRSVMHIGNDYKVLSGTGQYPWERTAGKGPITQELMRDLRRELGISRWSGSGALYGTKHQVKEARSLVGAALRGKVDRVRFLDRRSLGWLRRIEKPYRALTGKTDIRRALNLLPPLMDVLQGVPTEGFLASGYWRKRMAVPDRIDFDTDRCGLLWCSPVAPATGAAVSEVTRLATDIALRHGFEPIMSISLINERMTISTIALTYDREIAGEDERAMECYDDLTRQLLSRGFPPYRLNVAAMKYLESRAEYGALMKSLKTAMDPNGILAPGRYE